MADYNNNSPRPLLAEKRLLAFAALEVVRRNDDLRMTELNSHVLKLTSKLAIVRNERNEIRAEMDRRGIIHGTDHLNHPEGAEDLVVDDQGFDIGTKNRPSADDIFALAMNIQQITTRITEVILRIDELNDELAHVTSERDQMRDYLNGDGWGRFRLLPRDIGRTRQGTRLGFGVMGEPSNGRWQGGGGA